MRESGDWYAMYIGFFSLTQLTRLENDDVYSV